MYIAYSLILILHHFAKFYYKIFILFKIHMLSLSISHSKSPVTAPSTPKEGLCFVIALKSFLMCVWSHYSMTLSPRETGVCKAA